MEYIVSARKYRPMSFDSVVGQQALTTTLKNTVRTGKLAHAYLFCGPRGVGKTTCARIFAKAINCLNPTTEGEACNECESCKAFNEQRSYNIFELDAASNNSVDNIKQLMEQTRIPPQIGKYKVFIIDEVHMLSTQAFNAFLKTLEEPPAHVIFILATTEKHKILPTIISRCQIFDFERMTTSNIVEHLKMVAQKEGITYEEDALAVIAEKADGGMRDALSVFDQVVSFCQGNVTYAKVIEDLNVLDSENYFKIIDFVLDNKVSDIMVLLNTCLNKGFDGGQLITGLSKHVRNLMLAKDQKTQSLLEMSERQIQSIIKQAERCDNSFLYSALRIMNDCDVNYRQSSNKRLLVELTLIEVAQLTQEDSPGVGRSPKRLKSLFHKMIAESQQNVAEQVATAEHHRASLVRSAKRPHDSATPQSVAKKTLGSVLNTYESLAKQDKPNAVKDNYDSEDHEVRQFTQLELEQEWYAMCARMPQNMAGLAARLRNIKPLIKDFPNVEISIGNTTLLAQVEDIKGRIRATLSKQLHNKNIIINPILVENTGTSKSYTKRELFIHMLSNEGSIKKLHDFFDFEIL